MKRQRTIIYWLRRICVTRNTKIKAGYEKNKKKNLQNSITTYSTLWILNRMPQKKN